MKNYFILITCWLLCLSVQAQQSLFCHPGMLQDKEDLEYMKQKILAGELPWLTAFENLKKASSLDFQPESFTHVSMGAYGTNNIGSREFNANGQAAYHHALLGYVTGNKAHFAKAIEIINAWSYRLWDFDANNAKLTVGLSSPYFLNAAEILRYSDAGWEEQDQEQFARLIRTVLYPTIRDFFTEANGNWDGSMIYTLLCMGVYLDDNTLFERAVHRFRLGVGNSGITKYIYPTGQCQETTRDWDHVQLGLGEFAKAAQVAWTQKIDLYGEADDRLALGFEYAAKFLTGGNIPVFGILSQRNKEDYRDIYESVYFHYTIEKGIEMPFTRQLIEQHHSQSSMDVLTACRTVKKYSSIGNKQALIPDSRVKTPLSTGALETPSVVPPENAMVVQPGESIQKAIQNAKNKNQWIVLSKGIHTLNEPLKMESGITLSGQGKATILFLNPEINDLTIINATNDMHDVTIRDLLIEGATKTEAAFDPNHERQQRTLWNAPSRGGILFSADRENQMKNIRLKNLTVQNCTRNGVSVRGATGLKVIHCDFTDNGSSVVPGAGFHHNLHLTHLSEVEVNNSRFDSSMWGNGIDLSFCRNVSIFANESARNKRSGIRCADSKNIRITHNWLEGNDEKGFFLDQLMDVSQNIVNEENYSQYNGQP